MGIDSIRDEVVAGTAFEIMRRAMIRPLNFAVRKLTGRSPFRTTIICLRHRSYTHDLYKQSFSSGKNVMYISIMSQATLKEIPQLLAKAAAARTRIRVLTWDSSIAVEVVEAFRKHLGENQDNPARSVQQVKEAENDWRAIALQHPNIVELRTYFSIPTMQGTIVGDEWATIELFPYSAQPRERPALVLNRKADPEMFDLFKMGFEKLWDDAKPSLSP